MATACDTLEVDLSRVDLDVRIEAQPCIDVDLLQTDITIEAITVANQGPKGDPGPPGKDGAAGSAGPPGSPGIAATIAAGSTTTGAPGSNAAVVNTGSPSTAIFDFTIPQGIQGPVGPAGQGINIKGTVPNAGALPSTGNSPGDMWIAADTGHGWSWNGTTWVDTGPIQGPAGPAGAPGAPGDPGLPGPPGTAATVDVGSTTTGAAGSNALVTNSGSSSAAVFNFTVPQGVAGTPGPAGAAGPSGAPGAAGPSGAPGAAGATGPPGPQGPAGPTVVSSNAGNVATLGSDAKIYVPDPTPTIWSVRLRSFNAVGNPNFEVDQRLVGVTDPTWLMDRWLFNKAGTMAFNGGQIVPGVLPIISGFQVSNNSLYLYLATQQASLGVSDYAFVSQVVEGPNFRELTQGHSLSMLVYTNVANLKFSVALRDAASAKSITHLFTVSSASTWTLLQWPNIPLWMSGGTFGTTPGSGGYLLSICLAAGTNFITTPDVWTTGNFIGATGMDNFASKAVASQFICSFVQHEPGLLCTGPIDKPFTGANGNFEECLRYYAKSYDYGVLAGAANATAGRIEWTVTPAFTSYPMGSENFPKPLAKAPTIVVYSDTTGVANTVRDNAASADKTVTSTSVSTRRLHQMSLSAASTSGAPLTFHYTADTGW